MITISRAAAEEDVARARTLILEYAEWVRRDVDQVADLSTLPSFTSHETEFSTLPGVYGPPDGCLLLAAYDGEVVGCGALKRFDDQDCELKRVYVRPAYRGLGIGRALVEALIDEARRIGYRTMLLDTHASLMAARKLYDSLGFHAIDAYFPAAEDYLAAAVFMSRDL